MHKLVIPGELPNLNEIIKQAKSHYHSYADLKKQQTDKVMLFARRLKKMERIDLVIKWYCKNKKQDKDNIAAGLKFILDGLVQAGVIKNDGWSEIGIFAHEFYVDKRNPRVEVIITEVENAISSGNS